MGLEFSQEIASVVTGCPKVFMMQSILIMFHLHHGIRESTKKAEVWARKSYASYVFINREKRTSKCQLKLVSQINFSGITSFASRKEA